MDLSVKFNLITKEFQVLHQFVKRGQFWLSCLATGLWFPSSQRLKLFGSPVF